MSAPKTRDPLVVNTQDGSCWLRRAVTRDGRGLYALEGTPRCCPEYVLASLRELAEIGLRGMADALPVPVGSGDSSARRDRYAAAVLAVKELAGLFADVRAHVDPVMVVADAEMETLRARVAELEAAAGDGSTRTVDEDPIAYALTAEAEALHASSGAVIETPAAPLVEPNGCGLCGITPPHGRQWTAEAGWHAFVRPTQEQIKQRMQRRRSAAQLKRLLARQTEETYVSPLHHDYRTPHDLPEPGERP